MIVTIVIGVILGLYLLAWVGFGVRTTMMERDARQKTFAAGQLPSPMPDGFYQGAVDVAQGKWIGKVFDLSKMTGINRFQGGTERDPFKFYTGLAVRDKNLQVLKIDYDIPQNPWWLRHLLDEVVETSPGHYLGKLHVRWTGLTFTLSYFNLTK